MTKMNTNIPRILGYASGMALTFAMAMPAPAQNAAKNNPPRIERTQDPLQEGRQGNEQQVGEREAQGQSGAQLGQQQYQQPQGPKVGLLVVPADNFQQGIRVVDVEPQGPADKAGLQRGDYIMQVNDIDISDPRQFSQLIQREQAGNTINMLVMRNNQRYLAEVQLAERTRPPQGEQAQGQAAQGQDAQGQQRQVTGYRGTQDQYGNLQEANARANQAWLGIAMAQQQDQQQQGQAGIQISDTYPGGPAARGGLRAGDTIVQIDGQEVQGAENLMQVVGQHQPGDTIELTVQRQRGDTQQEITRTVTLGRRGDFLSGGMGMSNQDPYSDIEPWAMQAEQDRRVCEQHERIESMLREVLLELDQLRADVNAMKSGNTRTRTSRQETRDDIQDR